MELSDKSKLFMLAVLACLGVIAVCLLEPFPQDLAYHDLADQRRLINLPNALDVLSNLVFLVVGLYGLHLWRTCRLAINRRQSQACALFFIGVTLTAFGSGWYHLDPNNATLMWDRLPMALAFMALCAFVIAEYIHPHLGQWLLWPLTLIGLASVLWWYCTEQSGQGDLRFYALVQFLPMLLLPLVLFLFRSGWSHAGDYWWVFAWYGLAKVLEALDRPIYAITNLVSGHTLKHLAAAAGAAWFLWMLKRRYKHR
jgi:hypothetical protein